MTKYLLSIGLLLMMRAVAQPPATYSSAEILMGLQKLKVLGSVLYVAAHPDDENTRLLAWLAKDRQYRTGYLSITRGDGGQNLIGEEQGVALGLIRTQELLAARRIDGAEQFFTRAYDFGFSKSTEEAMRIWDKEKILGDVVWVIRTFRPDVIITRFPEDGRAGHGHHSASAVLAREAFAAAADPNRFTEHFKRGASPWQAKRILWNTYNFGSNNTISSDQFRVDVGSYNPLLGKGYGEIAAESRSQHKSQGFGVPASRGSSFEYFVTTGGEAPIKDLMDEVDISWGRVGGSGLGVRIDSVIVAYDVRNPSSGVKSLVALYKDISALPAGYWRDQKMKEVQQLIEASAGLFLEASSPQAYAVQGDSLRISVTAVNRSSSSIQINAVGLNTFDTALSHSLSFNRPLNFSKQIKVEEDRPVSQPYWLEKNMEKGSFNVEDLNKVGMPENNPAYSALFDVTVEGWLFRYVKPIRYKHTDPVKGELYQPLSVVPPIAVNTSPGNLLFRRDRPEEKRYSISTTAFTNIPATRALVQTRTGRASEDRKEVDYQALRGVTRSVDMVYSNRQMKQLESDQILASVQLDGRANQQAVAQINYDHIPSIRYFVSDAVTVLNLDIKTSGSRAGYIRGAGDKVPEALEQLGYQVSYLGENDITMGSLKQFDVIVVGVRAYNVHEWLNSAYEALMDYVQSGGVMVVQYNTNSFVGPIRNNRIGPYDFTITNGRVTDEESAVNFLEPSSPLLNWPNKINAKDFNGWVQERGIYFADKWSPEYKAVLGMKDPGEANDRAGSLLVAEYGKGRFVYTGLALFRQLPAGVGGAYRLFANIIANPNLKR